MIIIFEELGATFAQDGITANACSPLISILFSIVIVYTSSIQTSSKMRTICIKVRDAGASLLLTWACQAQSVRCGCMSYHLQRCSGFDLLKIQSYFKWSLG